MLPRTDLALEIRERFKESNIEIDGVAIEELYTKDDSIKVTTVDIINDNGSKVMSRPIGQYITIENINKHDNNKNIILNGCLYNEEDMKEILGHYINKLTHHINDKKLLIVGLGNKDVTPDSLGPLVIDQVNVTRHIINEFGEDAISIAAIAPGVMGQTGMEAGEIVKAIVEELNINIVIVIDALAARSINRLNNTIQLTNTGICPGAGVGNNRKELNKNTLGVEVVAIGVPTVVDATTIVSEALEQYMIKQGLETDEIKSFNTEVKKEVMKGMFVTPKDIDECVKIISRIIAQSINEFL